jgi:PilZ domain
VDGSSTFETTHRRRSLRRQVRIEAELTSSAWDGAVPLLVTDVSLHGMFVVSDLPLAPGEQVAVSFLLPRWPEATPFHARARVVRVALLRRRTDFGPAGMGLQFIGLRADQCTHLLRALHGLPPPLPRRAFHDFGCDHGEDAGEETLELELPDELGCQPAVLRLGPVDPARGAGLPSDLPLSATMSAILRERRTH